MTRLTKRDVEALLAGYDDDPQGAVAHALARALDLPDAAWPELVVAAGMPADTTARLLAGDLASLDVLARTLNELRGLPDPGV